MITAWVFYYSERYGRHVFAECEGSDFRSTRPEDWGLGEDVSILLVLQKASFLQAYLYGNLVRR